MTTEIHDIRGGESNCCGAPVYTDLGICSACKEPCEDVNEITVESRPDFKGDSHFFVRLTNGRKWSVVNLGKMSNVVSGWEAVEVFGNNLGHDQIRADSFEELKDKLIDLYGKE